MTKRTVIDHKTGITSEFITEDNKDIFHTTQDVQPVIEHCKILADNKPGKDIRHVAEVPMVVYQKACQRRMGERYETVEKVVKQFRQ